MRTQKEGARIPIGMTKRKCNLHSACFHVIFSNSEKQTNHICYQQDVLKVRQGNGKNCCDAGKEKHIFLSKIK